jgi:hypothetical protein
VGAHVYVGLPQHQPKPQLLFEKHPEQMPFTHASITAKSVHIVPFGFGVCKQRCSRTYLQRN